MDAEARVKAIYPTAAIKIDGAEMLHIDLTPGAEDSVAFRFPRQQSVASCWAAVLRYALDQSARAAEK